MTKIKAKKSKKAIAELSKERTFYISLVVRLLEEFEKEGLITPMQKSQCTKYVGEELTERNKIIKKKK